MSDFRFLTHVCNSSLIQDKEFVLRLVHNQNLTPKLLHELFRKCDFENFDLTDYRTQEILDHFVRHSQTTPDLINNVDAMFKNVPFIVLSAITQSMYTTSTILDRESRSENPKIAKYVAENLSSSESALGTLLYHSDPEVVVEAIYNPNTNPDDIRKFMEDGEIDDVIVAYANEVLEKVLIVENHLKNDPLSKTMDQVRRVHMH